MTSISAAGSGYLSPLQQLQKELQSEVTAGEISSADQDALTAALTDIDSSLRSSGSSSKTASPDDLMAKIDELIAAEVSSGKLTSDQAAELKEVFENAFSKEGPGRPSGPPPPPPDDSSSSSDDSSSSTSAQTTAELMQQFIKTLQESASASSASYSESGDTSSSKTASALLFDYTS
jgi:hypothetical protein